VSSPYADYTDSNAAVDSKFLFMNSVIETARVDLSDRRGREPQKYHQASYPSIKSFNLH